MSLAVPAVPHVVVVQQHCLIEVLQTFLETHFALFSIFEVSKLILIIASFFSINLHPLCLFEFFAVVDLCKAGGRNSVAPGDDQLDVL